MYLSFYGLKKYPFQSNPNPEYFWQGRTISEILLLLQDNILENRGIFLLTGEIGSGKTTIAAKLTQVLDNRVVVGTIVDPGLSMLDFLNHIAHAFNLRRTFKSKETFYIHFKHYLTTVAATGRSVLLIIDEAQSLTQDKFAEIESLQNGEKKYARTIKFLLVGQNSLHEKMQRPGLPGIEEQIPITASFSLAPLSLAETIDYIQNSLKHVGAEPNIFTPEAMQAVYRSSGGIIRQINVICDHTMLTAFLKEEKQITSGMIAESAKHLALPAEAPEEMTWQEEITPPPPADISRVGIASTWPRVGATLTAALLGGIFLYTQLPHVSADPAANIQASRQIEKMQEPEEMKQPLAPPTPAKPSVITISQPAIIMTKVEDRPPPHPEDTPGEIAAAIKETADLPPLELTQTSEAGLPSPPPEIVVTETVEPAMPEPAAKPPAPDTDIAKTAAQPEDSAEAGESVAGGHVAGMEPAIKVEVELAKNSQDQTAPARQEKFTKLATAIEVPAELAPEEIQFTATDKDASKEKEQQLVATAEPPEPATEKQDAEILAFLENLASPAAGPQPQEALAEGKSQPTQSALSQSMSTLPPEVETETHAPAVEEKIQDIQVIPEQQEETNEQREQIDHQITQQTAQAIVPAPEPVPSPSTAIAVPPPPEEHQAKAEVKRAVKLPSATQKRNTTHPRQDEDDPGAIIDWLLKEHAK